MIESQLVRLIFKLSRHDQVQFGYFLESGFSKKKEDVKSLYFFILGHQKKAKSQLTKQNAYRYLFSKQEVDTTAIRHLMSYLFKALQRFLVLKQIYEQPNEYELKVARVMGTYGIEKARKASLRKVAQSIKKLPLPSVEQHRTAYEYEYELYQNTLQQQRTAPKNLQEVNNALDLSFMAEKLKNCCLALSHQSVANVEYDTGLLSVILDYLHNNPLLSDQPLISFYYYYFMAATKQDGEGFFKNLQEKMQQQGHLLEKEEQRTIYLLAINYGIKKYNSGFNSYLKIVFELYKNALINELLLESGRLSPYAYKNIGGIALRLGELDWAHSFIHDYELLLPASQRENFVHFMLSKWYYESKDYNSAMRRLSQVNYSDIFLNLDAKVLLLKIYYELEEMDALESFLLSFQRFLERQKMMSYHKKNYLNTLYFTQKLVRLNFNDRKQLNLMRKKVEAANPVGEKEWLLEKLTKSADPST